MPASLVSSARVTHGFNFIVNHVLSTCSGVEILRGSILFHCQLFLLSQFSAENRHCRKARHRGPSILKNELRNAYCRN